MEKKNRIEKGTDGRYVFYDYPAEGLERVEYLSKELVKDNYKRIKDEMQKDLENLSRLNKAIKDDDFEVTKELDEFIRLADLAARANNKKKNIANREGLMSMLEKKKKIVSDIEGAMPELKRLK